MRRFVSSRTSITVVALDVGGTKIAGGLVTYALVDGERTDAAKASTASALEPPVVSKYRSIPTLPQRGGACVLADVVRLAGELIEEAGGDVAGIGVAAAGVIDPVTGAVRFANDIMPGWTGQPIKQRLEEELGVPAFAIGDVHAHALGEARWGAARGAESCLCVGVGTGLGGAYVLNGQVVRGFRGAAGHLGHSLHPASAGMPCACGKSSHVETVASGTALSARYQGRSFGDELDPALMGDTVAKRASEGELEAIETLEFAGRTLGEALGSWCNLFDPELVVLSGTVTQAGPMWHRALDEGFKSQVMAPLADMPIVFAALGSDAPLVGAAENLLDLLKM